MSRRIGATKTSYPCLLLASDTEQEKKKVDTSYVAERGLDEKEHDFQVGGPLWSGIWLCLMHIIMGIILSSCSYIPYIGESPTCIRVSILVSGITAGFCEHLGAYFAQPSKMETLRNLALPVGLLSIIFFFGKICTVLPAWESAAMVLLFVGLLAGPAVAYKQVTSKDPPTNYSDIVDSFSTWAGLIQHLVVDTSIAIFVVFSWKLMGCPPVLDWLL